MNKGQLKFLTYARQMRNSGVIDSFGGSTIVFGFVHIRISSAIHNKVNSVLLNKSTNSLGICNVQAVGIAKIIIAYTVCVVLYFGA